MINPEELGKKLFVSKGYPDPLDPNKESMDWGLSVAKSIENEWFRRHKNSDSRYYDNQFRYHRLRLYARAEQPIGKYKDELSVDGDLSWLNLDWTPVGIAPKFVDIIVNGMAERLFSVKVNAVDKIATDRKSKYRIEMEKDMLAKEMLMQAKQELGVNAFVNDPAQLPESKEELDIHMQLNYKQAIEIAAEETIDYLMKLNDYPMVKDRFNYDMVVLGVGAMKHSYDPSDGIKIEYVDPAYLVHSYSESPWREDCFYFGEVKKIPLEQLKKIKPDITPEQLQEAKNSSSDWDLYHRIKDNIRSEFDGHTCNVLFFCYKTTRDKVFKKKVLASGKIKMERKPADWNPPMEMQAERGFERIVKTEDVWFEGALILGSNVLLKWELAENMVRDKSNNRLVAPYVVISPRNYDDRAESLMKRMIPFIDQIQLVHLKLQQVAARVVPDGVYVDADGLLEIDLGDGKKYDPQRALQLFFQTGSVIGRSMTSMGELNHGKVPIQELNHNSGKAKIDALIGLYNQYMQMIRDATGLNEASDGSLPDERTLVGVQKLAALNSNKATKHVLDSGVRATQKISEGIMLRVSDLIKYSDSEEDLIDAIGAVNVGILDEIKDLPLHKFGIFIEVEPDAEEKQYLENNIQAAVAQGHIYLDDASYIREIKNVKLANQILRIRRKKKTEEEHKRSMESLAQQSEQQAKASEVTIQAEIQKEQVIAQMKMEIEQLKLDLMDRNQENEKARKMELMALEFDYNMRLKGIETNEAMRMESMKLENQRKLEAQKATQESQLTAQADTENGQSNAPVNFESSNDSMDGIKTNNFEPR